MKAGSLVLLATLSPALASPQQLYRQRVIDHFSHRPAQVELVTMLFRASNEGETKVCKDFTITEKALHLAFSWLKSPTIAFIFKTLTGVNP